VLLWPVLDWLAVPGCVAPEEVPVPLCPDADGEDSLLAESLDVSPDDCALPGDAGRRSPAGGSDDGERFVLSAPWAINGTGPAIANAASKARLMRVLRMVPPRISRL
jgi:hypothetical protein